MTLGQGTIRLFRVAGIEIFLHWSWFLVAIFEISHRARDYSSLLWNALEYLALFGIVLLHELGHALACRQVGGRADRIILWPLGGVAFVAPPQRPGATLWSIAAGPLVNVVLAPVSIALVLAMSFLGLSQIWPNGYALLRSIAVINIGLLIFNLLPIYPLDGGQILRSLLWFVVGRARSLMATTIIGFLGVGLLLLVAVLLKSVWLGIISVFILLCCWQGLRHALILARNAKVPRRPGFACPDCGAAPQAGAFWLCGHCKTAFDTFEAKAVCPGCGAAFAATQCLDCGSHACVISMAISVTRPTRLKISTAKKYRFHGISSFSLTPPSR